MEHTGFIYIFTKQMADIAAEVIEAVREGTQLAMQPDNAAALEARQAEMKTAATRYAEVKA